jgi:nucleoside-triphosphatase
MKILLTGAPRVGKTTLLEHVIEGISDKQGFITREIRENGERTGFELVSSIGETATFASVDSDSDTRVGRYGVDIDQLDAFLEDAAPIKAGNLLYVDEIGKMELLSDKFKQLVVTYLSSGNIYVGTIANTFSDEFTEQVLSRHDVVLINVNQENRAQVRSVLGDLIANLLQFGTLSPVIQQGLTVMAKEYAAAGDLTQLKKLFKNAIVYLAEGRVEQADDHTFHIKGNTNDHVVNHIEGWSCDCDLFNGRGSFAGNAGECSHIQSAKLTLLYSGHER